MMHGTEYIRINEDESVNQITIFEGGAHTAFFWSAYTLLNKTPNEYLLSDKKEFNKAAGYCIANIQKSIE